MKQASLLIALCTLLCMSVSAQTTTIEKKEKRITITTTKVDENGKAVTETWIAEGEQPEQILEKMAVNPDVMQKVTISDDGKKEMNEERLFVIRHAGDDKVIEGKLSDLDTQHELNTELEKIIVITDDKDHKQQKFFFHGDPTSAEVWVNGRNTNEVNNSNCAALGVYVNYDSNQGGCKINSLIDNGGALDAGLQSGDVITKIDEFDITDFPSLHDALANFLPGDVVAVRYVRNDKNQKIKVQLKGWGELPGHEWRARTDCDKPKTEDVTEDVNQGPVSGPVGVNNPQSLQLQNANAFPNPTEGVFALSFQSTPDPLKISITDMNGKVVYNENNDHFAGSYNRDIDLKGFPQGNYFITVTQNGKVFTQQIAKQ